MNKWNDTSCPSAGRGSGRGCKREKDRQTGTVRHCVLTPICVVIFFLNSLLRYNFHTTKFTHFKCMIKCFLYIYRIVQSSQQSNFRPFLSSPKETSCPLAATFHSHTQLWAKTNLLSVSRDSSILDIHIIGIQYVDFCV